MITTPVAKCTPTSATTTLTTKTSTLASITKVPNNRSLQIIKKPLTFRSTTSPVLNLIIPLLAFNCLLVISHGLPTSTSSNSSSNRSTSHHDNTTSNLLRERRFINFSPLVDQNPSNMLHIGEVPLDGYPRCAEWFSEYRYKCQLQYENQLNKAATEQRSLHEKWNRATKFVLSEDADWMKKAKCCGMWIARDCLVGYIEWNIEHVSQQAKVKSNNNNNYHNHNHHPRHQQLCPPDLTDRFRRLPTDEQVRRDVLDYCSEYSAGSLICRDFANSAEATGRPLSLSSPLYYLCPLLITLMLFSWTQDGQF